MNYVQCLKNWEISWIIPGNFVLRSSLTWQMERKHWPTVFCSFFDIFFPYFWLLSVFFEFFCQYFEHYLNRFQLSANNILHCAPNNFVHPSINVMLLLPGLVNGGSFSLLKSCQLLKFKRFKVGFEPKMTRMKWALPNHWIMYIVCNKGAQIYVLTDIHGKNKMLK